SRNRKELTAEALRTRRPSFKNLGVLSASAVSSFRLRWLFPLFLFRSRAGQSAQHSVITFVAGVLKYRPRGLCNGNLHGPWLRPRRRIIDGELVEKGIRVQASEPLRELHILAGASERRLIR